MPILVPPIPMFLLYKLPFDLITAIPWMVAVIIAAGSVARIISVVSTAIYRRFREYSSSGITLSYKIIRPALFVIVCRFPLKTDPGFPSNSDPGNGCPVYLGVCG